MSAADFPAGTKFFDVSDTLVAELPDGSVVLADGSPYRDKAKVFAYGFQIREAEFEQGRRSPEAP